MKKKTILSLGLCAALCLPLSGCGSSADSVGSKYTGIRVGFDDSDMISIIILDSSDSIMRENISVGSSIEDVHSVYGDKHTPSAKQGVEAYFYNSISGEILSLSDLNISDSNILFSYDDEKVKTITIVKI